MTKKDKDVKLVPFKLVRDFWDNRKVIPKGEVYDFPEGKEPRGSIKLNASDAKKLRGNTISAALDPVQTELDMLRKRLAALETPEPDMPEKKELAG